eukprot:gene10024-7914_t
MKSILYQICAGLKHIHVCRVIHRDLKPQNVLVDSRTHTVKIADLGLARPYLPGENKAYTERMVTLVYRAPEILLGMLYSTPVDMWSVGCIMAELANGSPLFMDSDKTLNQIGVLQKIFQTLGTPNEVQWPAFKRRKEFNWEFPLWNAVPWDQSLNLKAIIL